mmetsp:Transcript_3171/g.6552  ORF Transcript_3171/g.6552 Transcript_3171/m.6552 type:complete len:96 (+) Transcript_3171:587-874(+)
MHGAAADYAGPKAARGTKRAAASSPATTEEPEPRPAVAPARRAGSKPGRVCGVDDRVSLLLPTHSVDGAAFSVIRAGNDETPVSAHRADGEIFSH